jgi:hypothetical protein
MECRGSGDLAAMADQRQHCALKPIIRVAHSPAYNQNSRFWRSARNAGMSLIGWFPACLLLACLLAEADIQTS